MSKKPDMHRRCLEQWMMEWTLDRRLTAGKSDAIDHVVHKMRSIYNSPRITVALEPGHIWLLRPVPGSPAANRPVYVVILSVLPDATCIIAPFSRFAVPATPGEWSTGAKAVPLRVLCLWNARQVTGAMIRAGWRGSRLSSRQLEEARVIHRQVSAGMSCGSVAATRVGPPVRHPLDPRWVYLAEETEAFEESLKAVEQWLADGTNAPWSDCSCYDREPSVLRLAAESRAPYGKSRSRKKT